LEKLILGNGYMLSAKITNGKTTELLIFRKSKDVHWIGKSGEKRDWVN
jgi:hypothetical protein